MSLVFAGLEVKEFDVGVLGPLAGLDLDQIDAVASDPLFQDIAEGFPPVIQALGDAAHLDKFVEGTDDRLLSISIFIDFRPMSSLTLIV